MKMFQPLLIPVMAQAGLTLVVWIWMNLARLQSMIQHRVKMQELASDAGLAKIADTENISDNFTNQFEVPVLFYLFLVIVMFTYQTDNFYIYGAWLFVASRALHTIIHCTVNHVLSRYLCHFFGVAVLVAMWVRFAKLNVF